MPFASALAANDEQLLLAIKLADRDAFEVFYQRYSRQALALAGSILFDDGLAGEAIQEAFDCVWRRPATYDSARSTPRTWLMSIVHHRAIDIWRREHRRQSYSDADQHLATLVALDCTETEAIARVHDHELHGVLLTLPAEQRQIIELSFYQDFSISEIAVQVSIPLGTAKGRMRLALRKLRAALESQQPPPPRAPIGPVKRISLQRDLHPEMTPAVPGCDISALPG